jgi:hypothetical protein
MGPYGFQQYPVRRRDSRALLGVRDARWVMIFERSMIKEPGPGRLCVLIDHYACLWVSSRDYLVCHPSTTGDIVTLRLQVIL